MSSTLIAHCGGTYRTRYELATIPTPAGTDTWKPVPHYDLVGSLVDDLGRRGITVAREQYATVGRDGARLFGVMDLRINGLDTADLSTSLGLRGANDRVMAIQVIAAARVFVCDNLAFAGSDGAVVLKKKHTSRLDLASVVPPAIESYLEKAGAFRLDIDRMRDFDLTDDRAKSVVYDAFTRDGAVLPMRLLPAVHRFYFDDDEQRAKFEARSLWSLNNAFTEAVKSSEGRPPAALRRPDRPLLRAGPACRFGRVRRRDPDGPAGARRPAESPNSCSTDESRSTPGQGRPHHPEREGRPWPRRPNAAP